MAWEDKRFDSIQNWGLSFDYDANAWWQTNNNLAAAGACNGGGGTNNSCGALPALNSRPLRIMGQKLSSSDGAKNWGDDMDGVNKNNPQDIGLSSTGDVNRNPSIAIDGTDVILTWDSNSVIEADSSDLFIAYTNGFDVEAREDSGGYPSTSWGWGSATVVYNDASATDSYNYPSMTKDSNNKTWLTSRHYETGTIDEQVGHGDDDMYTWDYPSFTYDGLNDGTTTIGWLAASGLRFTTVNVTKNADVTSAYVTIRSEDPQFGSGTINDLTVEGEDTDDAARYTTISNFSGRSHTTATVAWDPPEMNDDTDYNTPDISTVIEEIVARSGWSSGNDMALFFWHTNTSESTYRNYVHYEHGASTAPKLHIEYSAHKIKAIQATNANDISAWGTATVLNTSGNTNQYGVIVPLDSGDMYASFVDGTSIEGCMYDEQTSDRWEDSSGSDCTDGANQDSIDTGLNNISDNIAAVADATNNDVHLVYISDEGTDQVSYRRWDNGTTTWDSVTLVADAADNDDAYVTISYDTLGTDLYAVWMDTSSNDIFYSSCDISTDCDAAGDWVSETDWKNTTSGTNVTSNYSEAGIIFAQWTEGSASPYSIVWDTIIVPEKLWLFFGVAPLIPLILRRKRKKKYAYLEQQQAQTIRKATYQDQSFWERLLFKRE